MMVLAGEAGQLAAAHDNVYLEASWTAGFLIREWVRTLGENRVMLGSDHADNAATEIAKVRSCGLKESEQQSVLGGNAAKVFGLVS